jgi:hypothetical protein
VISRVIGAHRDSYPALCAAFADIAAKGGQDQALEFGLARILDGVGLHIASRLALSCAERGRFPPPFCTR